MIRLENEKKRQMMIFSYSLYSVEYDTYVLLHSSGRCRFTAAVCDLVVGVCLRACVCVFVCVCECLCVCVCFFFF